MLCCRPLKICNKTIGAFATWPCQEPQPVEGIKLSEEFPSCTMFTSEQDSLKCVYVVGLLIVWSNTTPFVHFSPAGGLVEERLVIEGKYRICRCYCLNSFVTGAKDGHFLFRNIQKKGTKERHFLSLSLCTIWWLDCGFPRVRSHFVAKRIGGK